MSADSSPAVRPRERHEHGAVDDWVNSITENELPLFAQSLSEISSVASQARSSAGDLAQVITMDVSMSVRLLKIANSPMLNPQNRTIDSVRAAVVLMGFDAVRDLAFSLSLVSELHGDQAHPRVVELLAHAFHAASQAQVLARAGRDECPEEVFVAGLLLNVGEMAFWSRPRPETRDIDARLAGGEDRDSAERAVLGFSLEALSRRLAEEWRMSGLLRACMAAPAARSRRCRNVLLGDAIARTVERHGWESTETAALVDQAARRLDMPSGEVGEMLRQGTREAAAMARRFGVSAIEQFLAPRAETARPHPRTGSEAAARQPDPQAELESVRALQSQMQEKPDIDTLMRLALDGLYRGAAMDRALFAMLSPDRTKLTVRYAVGGERRELLRDAVIRVDDQDRSLFGLLLKTGKTVWVDAARRDKLSSLIGPEIDRWAGGTEFFAMPIFVRGRPVGLLYGDCSASTGVLSDAAFTSFRFFGEQIAAGMARR